MKQNQMIEEELDLLHDELDEHRAQYNRTNLLLKLGFVLTFLLYCVFNQSLYLGDPTTWVHYFDNTQAMVGFAVITVIAVLMALFLAWVKHAAYIHFGLYGSIGAIVFTVIAFALFAELFSSSANQDAKANIQIEHSSTYQSTLNYGAVGGAINAALTEQIASASKRLGQCQYRLSQGKEKHCEGDKAKLSALQAQSAAAMQAQVAANNAGQQLNYARQDKLKADSYNPVIVMMARFWTAIVGGEYTNHIKAATVLVMMFVSAAFETLHHFLSTARKDAATEIKITRKAIAAMDSQLDDEDDLAEPNRDLAESDRRETTNPAYPSHYNGFAPYSAFTNNMLDNIADEFAKASDARAKIYAPLQKTTYRQALTDAGVHVPAADTVMDQTLPNLTDPTPPAETDLTGQVAEPAGQVGQPDLTAEYEQKIADAEAEIARRKAEKAAVIKAKLAAIEAAKAEKERVEAANRELQAKLAAAEAAAEQARKEAEEAARQAEQERLAREAAERAEREAAAKAAAEAERLAREQARKEAEEAARQAEQERLAREAAERAQREAAAKAAAEQARLAAEEAERQAEAERLAELDGLTEDQVSIAARAIRAAVEAGEVTTLGFNSLKDVIKDAGLPRSNDRIRILIKLGLQELSSAWGSRIQKNPAAGTGKSDYIIV